MLTDLAFAVLSTPNRRGAQLTRDGRPRFRGGGAGAGVGNGRVCPNGITDSLAHHNIADCIAHHNIAYSFTNHDITDDITDNDVADSIADHIGTHDVAVAGANGSSNHSLQQR